MQKERWVVLAAFLLGCVIPNMIGRDFLTTYGFLNAYFLEHYAYRAIDANRLFSRILMERSKTAFGVFLLGRAMPGALFSLLVCGSVGVTCGFLLTTAVINLGLKGILICICGLFPQWLFYFAALFYYADCRREAYYGGVAGSGREYSFRYWIRGTLLLFCIGTGMFAECYVNPVLLAWVLHI